jgi:iron complex outermembrane receptor protein
MKILMRTFAVGTAAVSWSLFADAQILPSDSATRTTTNEKDDKPAVSGDITTLETVTVYGDSALTSGSVAEAQKNLARVPGGTSLVDLADFKGQAVRNLQDVLAYAPGVFAQTQSGADQTRLSIRGSSIAETVTLRGIAVLRDGLPLSQTNGQFRSTLLDPATAEYLEVYRGANALAYGASTLGGAINLVSPTGRTAPGFTIGGLVGDHDTIRPRVSAGFAQQNWDAYATVSGAYQDGFRDHLDQKDARFYGNLGWRHSSQQETRFHLDAQDLSQQTPGALTLAELRDDPTQADVRNIPIDARTELRQYRGVVRHTLRPAANQRLDLGVYYQFIDFVSAGRFGITAGKDRDVGLSLRHQWRAPMADAGGDASSLISGGRLAYGPSDSGRFAIGAAGERGDETSMREDNPLAVEAFTEYQRPLAPGFTGIVGASAVYARRDSRNAVLSGFGSTIDASEDFFGLSPKIGFLWQVFAQTEIFGNLSRSFELPDDYEFANAFQDGTVQEQTATTLELGLRGRRRGFNWDAAVYHARVKDEILSQELPLGSGTFITTNADGTLHTGFELGFGWVQPLGWIGADSLKLRGAYTWNDFHYDGDAALGDNELPGIPRHVGKAELVYQHASGFSFGPNAEAASAYDVDFANTLRAPGYEIWGLRAAFAPPNGVGRLGTVSVFVEGRNLGNRHYVASSSITGSALGADTRIFNPGLTRTLFAGIELIF